MTARSYDAPPTVVRLPLALLGVAIGADLAGRVTGSSKLQATGRALIPVVAGVVATRAVRHLAVSAPRGEPAAEAHLGSCAAAVSLAGAAMLMATWRRRLPAPSAAYLAAGLTTLGVARLTREGRPRQARYRRVVEMPPAGGPSATAELRAPQVAAAVRTEAGDKLRGL